MVESLEQKKKKKSAVKEVVSWLIYLIIFAYAPMYGLQIAFKDYRASKGIWGSAWVGFKHFERFFSSSQSISIIWNTLYLGFLTLVFCFPVPIILALIINEIRSDRFRNVLKTVTYAPHFVSTIVVVGMLMSMCSPSTGIINTLFVRLGLFKEPLYLMGSAKYFRTMYILSGIWKDSGWNAIIFISALAAVDTSLYEAAEVDGASRWQTLWKVTIPNMMSSFTICIFLTLTNGFKLFDQNLALTAGRPFLQQPDGSVVKTTEMLALNIYNAFYSSSGNNRGTAQAKAVLFFILVAAIGLIQLSATRKKEVQQ